ncbi:MAG: hypothetical protein AAGF94_02590 [Pseudomonadota bacterium]
MIRYSLIAASLLIVASCDAPGVRALDQQQKAGSEVQAATALPNDLSDPVNAKTARNKARACLELAQKAVATAQANTDGARNDAACARESYAKILSDADPVTAADFVGQMEAYRLTRETSTSTGAGRQANSAIAQVASQFSSAVPGQAAGPYYTADSLYWQASFASSTDRACDDLSAAAAALDTASGGTNTPNFPSFRGSVRDLDALVTRDAAQKGCA